MARARNSGMRTYTQADVDELVAESAKDKKNVIEAMGYSFNDSDDFLENLNILGGTVDFFLPCINLIRIVDNRARITIFGYSERSLTLIPTA